MNIDNEVFFCQYTNALAKNVSITLGIFRRILATLPLATRISMYNSFIYSKISYGILALGNSSLLVWSKLNKFLLRAKKLSHQPVKVNLLLLNSIQYICNYFVGIKCLKPFVWNHLYFDIIFNRLRLNHEYKTPNYSSYMPPPYIKWFVLIFCKSWHQIVQ